MKSVLHVELTQNEVLEVVATAVAAGLVGAKKLEGVTLVGLASSELGSNEDIIGYAFRRTFRNVPDVLNPVIAFARSKLVTKNSGVGPISLSASAKLLVDHSGMVVGAVVEFPYGG